MEAAAAAAVVAVVRNVHPGVLAHLTGLAAAEKQK
jgi:hypothetical protein